MIGMENQVGGRQFRRLFKNVLDGKELSTLNRMASVEDTSLDVAALKECLLLCAMKPKSRSHHDDCLHEMLDGICLIENRQIKILGRLDFIKSLAVGCSSIGIDMFVLTVLKELVEAQSESAFETEVTVDLEAPVKN